MTTAEVVAKTLIDEHSDFLREAVALSGEDRCYHCTAGVRRRSQFSERT